MKIKKKLPIGIDDFKKLRTEGFYYVDKTAMIQDLLRSWGEVNLFTRPRRFGKTLNMSMLKAFFEIGCEKELFDDLEISRETELCERYMGKFPVVSVTLKGIEGVNYKAARSMAVCEINREARRLGFLAESEKLTEKERETFSRLLERDMEDDILNSSLKTFTELLEKHYQKKVILLIDEYDVPLAKANEDGYYEEMIRLIRDMFNQALKTNDSLYFAVLTGCLRVSKESIFTGLNNPVILSITTVLYDEYFGFTDDEVREMLKYYSMEDRYDSVKEWYDGYRFGNVDVYCPWDVINHCYELIGDPSARPKNYWSNTSGNDIIRHFIERLDDGLTRGELESLVAGETVTKEIHEELTYRELYDSTENIWSVLFMTGYLTCREVTEDDRYVLSIPNREIRSIFSKQIMAMFKRNVAEDGKTLNEFCDALKTGNAAETERLFNAYLGKTVSIRDSFVQKGRKESFYHGILLGILGLKGGWNVKSNEESDEGYCDISVKVENEGIGIIIEMKYAEREKLEEAGQAALDQVDRMDYAQRLCDDDYEPIYKYGIACFKKRCRVVCSKI